MAKQKAKFYVVWQGRTSGIYDSWAACEAQVKGVAAKYKGFSTREEAERAFAEGYEKHISFSSSNRSIASSPNRPLTFDEMIKLGVKLPALAVDAACSGRRKMSTQQLKNFFFKLVRVIMKDVFKETTLF